VRRIEIAKRRDKPLKLKPFSQRSGYCGPASMKIVCAYFGRDYEEKYLGDLCGTTADDGTDHIGMLEGAKAVGATVFSKDRATLGDLKRFLHKQHLPVIVGWYSPTQKRKTVFRPGKDEVEDHFSVVYHVSSTHVYLMDPEAEGGKKKIRIGRFLKLWWDTDTPKCISVQRWMMVMRFDGKEF
jgi:ABC-type bacteriocin/lantibiotic exporter with double-glycine peptidase domain